MESVIFKFFFHNWQRKIVALCTAIVIWLFVNSSMTETVTLPNITVRIINLPEEKTIVGLLPNGILSRRITLTLSGSKAIVEDLEPGDLEVVLDASSAIDDELIASITKKNLISLNPAIDLLPHIRNIYHSEFVVRLVKLVTGKLNVTIAQPTGTAPQGYEFLDVWPQHLTQTVSGAEEDILRLKDEGLEIHFELSEITKQELDELKSITRSDEISYSIPSKWKEVAIPFRHNVTEPLNDPEAPNLRIDFLRKEFLALNNEIPIRIFYPLDDLDSINPTSYSLTLNDDIQKKLGVFIFKKPLYVTEVPRLFLDIVRNSIEVIIVAVPKNKRKVLAWSIQYILPRDLEDSYVASYIANTTAFGILETIPKQKEELLRKRFRDYMQKMTLFLSNGKKLHLKSTIEDDQIKIITY